METADRQDLILDQLRRSGKVRATPLAAQLGVTVQTIRRDLRELSDAGRIERIHGGAVLPSGVRNIGYDDRRSVNRDAKQRIGEATARLIPDNASLFLNIGTTTEAVARALARHRNLMVVTNNLNVAMILATHPSCDVVVAGGNLRRADGGLVGDLAALAITRFRVDIAVLGTSAIDPGGDLLDFDPEEVRVSQQVLAAARSAITVADASKFTRKAPVRVGSLADVGHLVTDAPPPAALAQLLQNWAVRTVIARP